jgi:DNA-binding PadR family transcriptional regulator
MLTKQPMSGYDIKRFLKTLSWLIGSPSFGSLYPALRGLLEDELVTVDLIPRPERQPRKIYTITELGREALQAWVDRPVAPEASLKAFAMRLVLASNFTRAGLLSHLHQRRAQVAVHKSQLEERITAQDENSDLGHSLVLEYGLALARAESDWLQEALDNLSQETVPKTVLAAE